MANGEAIRGRSDGFRYSFAYSKGWNTQRNTFGPFFPDPPPPPEQVGFPTSRTQQEHSGAGGWEVKKWRWDRKKGRERREESKGVRRNRSRGRGRSVGWSSRSERRRASSGGVGMAICCGCSDLRLLADSVLAVPAPSTCASRRRPVATTATQRDVGHFVEVVAKRAVRAVRLVRLRERRADLTSSSTRRCRTPARQFPRRCESRCGVNHGLANVEQHAVSRVFFVVRSQISNFSPEILMSSWSFAGRNCNGYRPVSSSQSHEDASAPSSRARSARRRPRARLRDTTRRARQIDHPQSSRRVLTRNPYADRRAARRRGASRAHV